MDEKSVTCREKDEEEQGTVQNSDTLVVARLQKTTLEENKEEEHDHSLDQSEIHAEALVKHPLQNRWAFWYYKNERNKDWKLNQKIVTTFDTVEDFWAVFNHIQPASKIQTGCDYSVFKDGIKPMWEDSANRKGGRWVINLEKQRRNIELDQFWLETLLCLIGEAFEELSDEICGAVINLRPKGDKLGLWTADASKGDANVRIGRTLKSRLNIPNDITIGYEAHTDSMSKSGSTAKNRYHV